MCGPGNKLAQKFNELGSVWRRAVGCRALGSGLFDGTTLEQRVIVPSGNIRIVESQPYSPPALRFSVAVSLPCWSATTMATEYLRSL